MTLRLPTDTTDTTDGDDELTIHAIKSGRNKAQITVKVAGETIRSQILEIQNPEHRALFARGIADEYPGLDQDTISRELMNIAGNMIAKQASFAPPVGDDDPRTKIVIDTDEYRVVDEIVSAIGADPNLYCRGNALVRTIETPDPITGAKATAIGLMPPAALRAEATRHVLFTEFVKRDGEAVEVAAHPPAWAINAVDQRGSYPGIRPLLSVSNIPVLRPDGSIWQTEGYDAQTCALFKPTLKFPTIPNDVGGEDAEAAAKRLLDVVGDVPFDSDDHRSAWLASLLSPIGRSAYTGPTPLFAVDANSPGAGKGLLVNVVGRIVSGRNMAVSSYSEDPDEMSKRITANVISGVGQIHLDNVETKLGNEALDRALTGDEWTARVLGKSENVTLPLRSIWYATGNNIAVASDSMRRIIYIRLNTLEESPEARRNFKRPHLLEWVSENRGRLVADALTILRAYTRAGMPDTELDPLGSFEGWSRLIRGAIVYAGLPDPCKTRVKLAAESDTVGDALRQLFDAWLEVDAIGQGIVVADLLARLYAKEYAPSDPGSVAMRAALENLVGSRPGSVPSVRQVAARFKHYRMRIVDGRYLSNDPEESRRGGALWRLARAS